MADSDADKLFEAGRYKQALERYQKLLASAGSDESYTNALFRAAACEQLLGQHEKALDRVRAAKLPSDVARRAMVLLLRLELLRNVDLYYGASEVTEEGASGSAKLSRAQLEREQEAALQALWSDRAALAKAPLASVKPFVEQKDIDPLRYPAVWDFVVLRLTEPLVSKVRGAGAADTSAFVESHATRDFGAGSPPSQRLAVLYEETQQLAGGSVDRQVANDRWEVVRVMLPYRQSLTMAESVRKAYRTRAVAVLSQHGKQDRSAEGRADASLSAAELLVAGDDRVAALALVDDVLARKPDAESAMRARRLRQQILAVELQVSARATRLPAKGALTVNARNLGTAYLRLYRVDPLREANGGFFSQQLDRPREDRLGKWLAEKPLQSWSVDLKDAGDHRSFERACDPPVSANGLYLIIVSPDAKFAAHERELSSAFLNVTDLAVARADTDEQIRYYTFDAQAGTPAPNAELHVLTSTDWNHRTPGTLTTSADGVGVWKAPKTDYLQTDALAMRTGSIAFFGEVDYRSRPPKPHNLELFLASDRPIYRPGQPLDVRVTAVERVGESNFKPAASRAIVLSLQDPNGQEVAKQPVTTGALGSAAAHFTLPGKGLLGSYSITAKVAGEDNPGALAIAVEEYKRPEFEITLEAPKGTSRYGQKATVSGKIAYYFGGAAGDVSVKYKVSRTRWLPWWYWNRGGGKTELSRGEVKSQKDGTFEVSFTPSPDPTRIDETPAEGEEVTPDIGEFAVEIEAHDAGGRTITAERSVRIGDQALLVSAQLQHGFFLSDEAPVLDAQLSNLEEHAVAGQATWEVAPLSAPSQKPLSSDSDGLPGALRRYPAGKPIANGQVRFTDGKPTPLTLPRLPAGGWRVTFSTQDPWGKPVRGKVELLVADARSHAVPLALPPLAIARKTELQVGDTAQVLVGGGWASGSYHVEVWRGSRVQSHRVEAGAPVRVVEVPVTAAQADGFSLRWLGVSGVEVQGGEVALRVPRKDKSLTVTFSPRSETLEPGQKAHWGLAIKDGKGHPVESEALVTIYDRSLELYGRGDGGWADSLYGPPPSPGRRVWGVELFGPTMLGVDNKVREALEKQLRGGYQDRALPRFSWTGNDAPGGGRAFRGALFGGVMAEAKVAGVVDLAPQAQATPAEAENETRARAFERTADGKDAALKRPPPAAPQVRTNMAETALFLPDLRVGSDGKGSYSFTAPERLTSWRVQVWALGKQAQAGRAEDTFTTRKDLMVRVELPRFAREGDHATVTAIVHNETDKPVSGKLSIDAHDVAGKPALATLGLGDPNRTVSVPAHGLTAVDFAFTAPETITSYKLRASVVAGAKSDAEERELPILPSRERLVQSHVVALKGNDGKTIEFPELQKTTDATQRSESMMVSIEPQLALSILRSIPFLVEYPYECVEQTLNRYVPLAIVQQIYRKHPELARALAAEPHRKTQEEPWLSDDPRRLLALTETPWLRESEGGANDARLRDLLDPALVARLRDESFATLQRTQRGDGGFPWFPGGDASFYMTLYVLDGLATLEEFGVEAPRELSQRAIAYVGRELERRVGKDEASVAFLAYGAYVLSAFDGAHYPAVVSLQPKIKKWAAYVIDNRRVLTPFGRAWMARVMARLGDKARSDELLDSALDGAQTDPVTGVYWTPERYAWHWYADTVEKHAFFLRTLEALRPKDPRIPGIAQWLLFNRKSNRWHSTKASAAAVYSLLGFMQAQGALSKPEQLRVKWAGLDAHVEVRPDDPRKEPLSWRVAGAQVTPAHGTVRLEKQGPGIAFASATWIFSSQKLQAAHGSELASIERKYFRVVREKDGDHRVPLKDGDHVKVGEPIEARLYVKTGSALEFVHIKEPHGAGFEETELRSGYHWDAAAYYEEPRDSLVNFFVDQLPHGELELHHALRPATPGTYRISSAVLQSVYSPDVTAYSAGMTLIVDR